MLINFLYNITIYIDKELFWHNDAENSLLHLGISISGTRILHSKRANTESGYIKLLFNYDDLK